MKRTDFVVLATFATLFASAAPVIAEDAHHPDQAAPATATGATSARTAPAAAPPAANAAGKAELQMQKAQELMGRIQAARDPAERRKLMHDHLQAMREGLGMMREMAPGMGPGMAPGMGGGMMMGMAPAADGRGAASAQGAGMMGCDMMAGHGMMEKRLAMMQMMMEQMLQRDAVRDAAPLP